MRNKFAKEDFISTIKSGLGPEVVNEVTRKSHKAVKALVKQVFEQKKSVVIATAVYDEYTTFYLEKVDEYYFILKRVRFNSLEEPEADMVDFRTKLSQSEVDRLDPDNYEDSFLELATELDQEQVRFGI